MRRRLLCASVLVFVVLLGIPEAEILLDMVPAANVGPSGRRECRAIATAADNNSMESSCQARYRLPPGQDVTHGQQGARDPVKPPALQHSGTISSELPDSAPRRLPCCFLEV